MNSPSPKGRGSANNPPNRFSPLRLEPNQDEDPSDHSPFRTAFFQDHSETFITYNDSPDVGFTASINPYRGCEHGCAYCYARPTHEYLGFSSGLDFETKIMVKEKGPAILRKELAHPRWQPQVLAMSGVTDCYQPIERRLQITRQCLEVLAEFKNPVCIVTKNHLVTRDIDLLTKLASDNAAAVYISITTLSSELASKLEPRASSPPHRLEAIHKLSTAGIQAGVLMAPIIPGLTDHEIPALIQTAAKAGAAFAGYVALRLPYAVASLFSDWLEHHFPAKKQRILNQIRSMRNGKLNNSQFGSRMQGEGIVAHQIQQLFAVSTRRAGIFDQRPTLSTASFKPPPSGQMLFPNLWIP